MKTLIRKALTALALAVGFTTAATAATPVGVWDGFSSLTSGDYTWTASAGTTVSEEGVLTIGSDGGLTIANPTGLGDKAVTFIADIEGYDPEGTQMTIFDIGLSSGNRVNDSNLSTTDKAVYQLYNAKNGYGNVGTISTGKVRIIMTYSAGAGTTTYVVGGNTASSSGLKESSSTIASLGIGCYKSTERVAAGMKVYRLAMFNSKLSESEAKAYQFPSEAALSKMYSNKLSTGGEQIPAATYGAIEVTDDGYKATRFTEATKLSNTASGEEITGSYANIIKKPSGDTDIYAHTVMGWFKIDELPTEEGAAGATTIYAAKSYDGDYGGYKVAVGSDGTIYVGQCNNEAWRGSQATTTTKVAADTWFHLAVSVPGRGSARTTTATVFINGQDAGASTTAFGTNLNGNKCEYIRISGGISAAGIYVDTNAIVYPSLAVEAATTYVAPYVAATEYSTTVNQDMTWSEIREVLLVDDEEFAENAQITLTMDGEHTITFDTMESLTGSLAFLKIVDGNCNVALADDLYEDGCWSKTVFTAPLIEFVDADVTGVLKDGFNGAWTLGPTEIAVRAQNKEVISINIAGGKSGGAGADSPTANLVAGEDFYGIAPTVGSSWNNINKQWQSGGDKTIEIQSPLAYDGATTIQRPTMSLSATGRNTWQADSISNPFLRGYLDDPGGVTVVVHGVPYTKYDVIVYTTSDSAVRLAPVTINGTMYTFNDEGQLIEGDAVWGVGQYATPEIGKNAIRINDCTGEQLTVNAVRHSSPDGRATICAVQVINKGDVVVTTDYVGVMSGDVEWTDGSEDENLESVGDPWVNGEYSTITITNIAANGTFTFTQETEGLKFKVVSEEDCALTILAKSIAEYGKFKELDFTEAAGGVTIELPEDEAFDPTTLPDTINGNWKFSKTGVLVFDGTFPTAGEQTFFKSADDWVGTVWLKNVALAGTSLDNFCNANSILRFTGVTGWLRHNSAVQGVPTLELMDEGDTLAFEVTDSSQDKVYNFAKFIGDGTFRFATKAASGCVMTITDVSEFTGKLLSTNGDDTTARPIFVGTDAGTSSTKSLITFADGANINLDCGWEAAEVAFGATLTLMTGAEGGKIVDGLTMESPVYLATKVTYPDSEDFSCLGYEDGGIWIREAVAFSIADCENATFAVAGAFEEGGSYYAADGAPVKVTYTANDGYAFAGGSKTMVIEATVSDEMEPIEVGEEPMPENGISNRTFDDGEATTWTVEEGTPWTVVPFDGEEVQTNAAIVGSVVTLYPEAEETEVTMNLANATDYAELRIVGDNVLTLVAGEDAVAPTITRKATIGADVTVDYNAVAFGAIEVASEKTLTFDFTDYPFDACTATSTNVITGVVSGDGTVTATGLPETTAARTVSFEKNEATGCYELVIAITVDETKPFVYTIGEAEGVWTWDGAEVSEGIVDANISIEIVKEGTGALTKALTNNRVYTVNGGTLKAGNTNGKAIVTVGPGATFDVNGKESSEYTVTLKGGAYVNTGTAIGNTKRQINQLTVAEADSMVDASANFGLIAGGYAANTLNLGGQTLTKTGTATFWICNTTVTNGTFKVEDGTIQVTGGDDTRVTVFAADASLELGEGTTLAVARPLTIGAITADGATIDNTKSITPFTLTGTATLTGDGTWSTNTLASDAVVNVGQKRDFIFAGAGTVNVTLTDAEYEAGEATLFEMTEEAETVVGTIIYNDEDITEKCTVSGNQITAIQKIKYPEWIDPKWTETAQKYADWALAKGVDDQTVPIKEAFLFNVDNNESSVEAAQSAFVIHGITLGTEEGYGDYAKIEPPNPDDVGVVFFNGDVIVRGATDVDGDYTIEPDGTQEGIHFWAQSGARFFKAFLVISER